MFKRLYSQDPTKSIIDQYTQNLLEEGSPRSTIKNYLTDIKQFMIWRESNSSGVDIHEVLEAFSKDMAGFFSSSSVKRKVSSIKRFLEFERGVTNRVDRKRQVSSAPWAIGFGVLLLVALFSPKQAVTLEADLATSSPVVNVPNSVVLSANVFDSSKGVKVVLPQENLAESKNEDVLVLATLTEAEVINGRELISKENSGVGTIYSGKNVSLLVNESIRPSSFVYLTPGSSTNNQTLYIKELGEGYLIVAIDKPASEDITYYWKLDTTEVYHSIF